MGNFICATVILILIIIFVTINSILVCNICDDMLSLIDAGETEYAARIWREKMNYIALFVRDAEIDVVTAEVSKIEQATPIEDTEAAPDALTFREAVTEVKNSERFSWQGLF